jgi:hypothetical protein
MTRETVLDLLMGAASALEDVIDDELLGVVDALEDMVDEGEIVEVTL